MPNQFERNPEAFLARVTGRPPPAPSAQETRNNLLRYISSLAGGESAPASVGQLREHPAWGTFVQQAQDAGLDPVELVNARNQNIQDFESGGFASDVGDFMDRSGIGNAITYGTIGAGLAGAGTAIAGAAGAGGGGAAGAGGGGASTFPLPAAGGPSSITPLGAGGASAAGAGNAALQTIGLPSGVGPMTAEVGSGVVLPGAATGGGMASMPPASSIAGSGGGGALSTVSDFLGGGGGMWGQIGGSLISGILGTRAAGRAADAQGQANQAAIDEQRRQFDTIMELTAPGREVGNQSMNAIANMLGLPGVEGMEGGFDAESVMNMPGTETIVNDAIRRIRQSGAARGSAGGNVLTELGDRISGFQSDRMTNALFNLAGFGPQATGTASNAAGATGANVGNLLQSSGIANASGILGAGRSQNAAIQNVLQYQALRGMLNNAAA